VSATSGYLNTYGPGDAATAAAAAAAAVAAAGPASYAYATGYNCPAGFSQPFAQQGLDYGYSSQQYAQYYASQNYSPYGSSPSSGGSPYQLAGAIPVPTLSGK